MLTKLEANAEARGLNRGGLEKDIQWVIKGKITIEEAVDDLDITIEELRAKAKELGYEL